MSNSKPVKESDKSFQEAGTTYANVLGQEGALDGHGVEMVRDSIIREQAERIGRKHPVRIFKPWEENWSLSQYKLQSILEFYQDCSLRGFSAVDS